MVMQLVMAMLREILDAPFRTQAVASLSFLQFTYRDYFTCMIRDPADRPRSSQALYIYDDLVSTTITFIHSYIHWIIAKPGNFQSWAHSTMGVATHIIWLEDKVAF